MLALPLRDRVVTCLPQVPLEAIAGGFGELEQIEGDESECGSLPRPHPLRNFTLLSQVVANLRRPRSATVPSTSSESSPKAQAAARSSSSSFATPPARRPDSATR